MKLVTMLLGSLLGTATAYANPVVATAPDVRISDRLHDGEREEIAAFLALKTARVDVATSRARWDAAVEGGHPVAAGIWARRHFEAMQARTAAQQRWRLASDRVNDLRVARR
ncbi:MAG: hypothetical protein ABI867_12390 [Kofleriaceae bacterium]